MENPTKVLRRAANAFVAKGITISPARLVDLLVMQGMISEDEKIGTLKTRACKELRLAGQVIRNM